MKELYSTANEDLLQEAGNAPPEENQYYVLVGKIKDKPQYS